MLILAGITIKEAKENTKIGEEKEILQLAYISAIINNEQGEFKKNFDNELDNIIRKRKLFIKRIFRWNICNI